MSTWLVIVIFSVGALLLFVIGMSLTLLIKGHPIQSEIATNPHMRARGITCAAHDARHATAASVATDCPEPICAEKSCATCVTKE